MHVNISSGTTLVRARTGVQAALACSVLIGFAALPANASASSGVEVVDAHLVTELEQHALTANAREQAFLYADLADKLTMLAGKQIADGDTEQAEATLERMEVCTAKMESNFQQSKSLKKTELLLHMTHRRLSDLVRAASMDARPHVQAALKRLDAAQTALLTIIFSK